MLAILHSIWYIIHCCVIVVVIVILLGRMNVGVVMPSEWPHGCKLFIGFFLKLTGTCNRTCNRTKKQLTCLFNGQKRSSTCHLIYIYKSRRDTPSPPPVSYSCNLIHKFPEYLFVAGLAHVWSWQGYFQTQLPSTFAPRTLIWRQFKWQTGQNYPSNWLFHSTKTKTRDFIRFKILHIFKNRKAVIFV